MAMIVHSVSEVASELIADYYCRALRVSMHWLVKRPTTGAIYK